MTSAHRLVRGHGVSSGDGMTVRGGAGGIAVALDDLEATGGALLVLAGRLLSASQDLLSVAAAPAVIASVVVAPVSGLAAEHAVAGAAGRLGALSAELGRLGGQVLLAAALYRQADAAATAAVACAQDTVGFGVGVALGLGWVLIPVSVGVGWAARRMAAGYDGPGSVIIRTAAHGMGGVATAAGDVTAEQPWLMASAAGGTEDLVAGAAVTGFVGSPVGLLALLTMGPGALSGSREVMLRGLLRHGPQVGLMDDGGGGRAVPLPAPVQPNGRAPRPPRGLGDLAASMDDVGALSTVPRQAQRDPWRSRVRVSRAPQPAGGNAWVVVIPGTQTWAPTGGANPSDLTSNLTLLSDQSASADGALVQAATDAMTQAGIAPGDPVLVAGHSQGGIAAAALAARLDSPFTITHVYTEGSPIADLDVPDSVSVLAVEHSGDLVPNLDDGPGTNPDTATWTTVTAPVPTAAQVTVPDEASLAAPLLAHESRKYQYTATALDHSDHPSVVAWRDSAVVFFTGRGEVSEYRMERVPDE